MVDRFEEDGFKLIRSLARYRLAALSGKGKVLHLPPIQQLADSLQLQRWIREGGLTGEDFQHFTETYLSTTTALPHPGFMAHQVAQPHPHGALGSLIDGFTNNAMAIYEMGPVATAMEFLLLNWMMSHLGWQEAPWPNEDTGELVHGGGVLTHGGSLANLTALSTARAHAFPDAWQQGYGSIKPAVLAPKTSHYSISRATGIMGLGTQALFPAQVDSREVLIPDHLPSLHQSALAQGYIPFVVVANACSTATGLYDPLDEVAHFCRQYKLWFHVDGAHGAAAAVSPKTRHLVKGIEYADSVTWDAHKMLQVPTLCAAVLVRDSRTLDQTFRQQGSYLFHEKDQPGIDFVGRAVECTKAGLGLRFFFSIAANGEAAMADHVANLFQRAHQFYTLIGKRPGFHCPVEPQANIVCFRFGEDDSLQLELRNRLVREGDYYIGSTLLNGKRYLRLVIMNPATDEHTLTGLLDTLENMANKHM